MKKTLALALVLAMLCVCVFTVSAAETTLPDVDSAGFWGAHSAGIEVTAEGVDITFTSTSYADASLNWEGPMYVLFTDIEAKVNASAEYREYWVQRGDNAGWSPLTSTWVDMAALNAAGITMVGTCGNWDALWADWMNNLKAGCEVKIHAELQDGNAVITMQLQTLEIVTTVPVDTSKPVYLALTAEKAKLTNIKVSTAEEETPVEPASPKTITVGDRSYTVEAGKWLYNTFVNGEVKNDPSNAYMYSMLIFDKDYAGEAFSTNTHGCAIVLDQYGTLVRIYDGANGGFWTAEGKAASTHFNTSNYATVAWSELQDGELLIIFPNDGASNTVRNWALGLRNAPNGPSECGKTATLEGFTFETAPVEPPVTEPTEPETTAPEAPETTAPEAPETTAPEAPETTAPQSPETTVPETTTPTEPEDPSKTGDIFSIFAVLMAVSGTALVILKKKN